MVRMKKFDIDYNRVRCILFASLSVQTNRSGDMCLIIGKTVEYNSLKRSSFHYSLCCSYEKDEHKQQRQNS